MIKKQSVVGIVSPTLKLAAGIIIIAAVRASNSFISPLLLALFISIICAHPILWLEKKKIPSWASIPMVLGGLALILFILGSIIGKSLSQFSSNIPQYEASLNTLAASLSQKYNLAEFGINFDQIISKIDTKKILSFTSGLLSQLGNLMSNSFLILLVTIFILVEMGSFSLKAKILESDYGMSLKHLAKLGKSVRHYLALKTVISLITGVLITVWLMILGVDYPILWGVIAFLLNYIPNIGSIIAAIPTMLLALIQLGFDGFILTGIAYLVVNIIMGNVIEPKIMGKGLGLSTLIVFISLIVWGYVFGMVGMFLAVPITLSIKIILENNENTRWISLLLGSDQDTKKFLDKKKADKNLTL